MGSGAAERGGGAAERGGKGVGAEMGAACGRADTAGPCMPPLDDAPPCGADEATGAAAVAVEVAEVAAVTVAAVTGSGGAGFDIDEASACAPRSTTPSSLSCSSLFSTQSANDTPTRASMSRRAGMDMRRTASRMERPVPAAAGAAVAFTRTTGVGEEAGDKAGAALGGALTGTAGMVGGAPK